MVYFLLSLNFHHSSLIILKCHVCLAPLLTSHHLIFFILFVSPIPVTRCSFFFFFSTQTHRTFKKKKKTKTNQTSERRRRKKKKLNSQPRRRKKKESKDAARYYLWVPYVYLVTILSLSYELWKLKTAKMYFQFS